MPSAPIHNPSTERVLGATRRCFQVQAATPRKKLKKAETPNPRSPAKHWTSARWRPSEKYSPQNLKVPEPTARTANKPCPGSIQTRPNPNRIEQNRTTIRTICRRQQQMLANRSKIHAISTAQRPRTAPSGARRWPGPRRLRRHQPASRSPMNSSPVAHRGRSGCPLRSKARHDRSAHP